jgi:GNAT superfamily N-acetyltransferase
MLGRLAVAESHQGQGIGSLLVAYALQRVFRASELLAGYALMVDAKNDKTIHFYQTLGFIQLPDHPAKLFLPLNTVTGLL